MILPAGLQEWLDCLGDLLEPGSRQLQMVTGSVRRTVERAMTRMPDGTIYVATGDIPAMWLRDSAAQVRPLLRAAGDHPDVAEMINAVLVRQYRYLLLDTRANAFNPTADGAAHSRDFPDQSPWVWERKYELDSACWVLDLAHRLWLATGATEHLGPLYREVLGAVLDIWELEQDHSRSEYRFHRPHTADHDTLAHGGAGNPVGWTGMTWTGFRPSDDDARLGYLVPANAFAAVALDGVAQIGEQVLADADLVGRVRELESQIRTGLATHGVVPAPAGSPVAGQLIYAYEVDGLGGVNLMDDANIPSLLSLPYLGFCDPDDPLYLATRAHILSPANPWFAGGKYAAGIGSIHTPAGMVWPLALAIDGLTSIDSWYAHGVLDRLEDTTAGTGHMHEAFDPDDPARFTRPWFSWADMTYVELALTLAEAHQARL